MEITDDLEALLAVLPPRVKAALERADRGNELLEIVLDLGRVPEARFLQHELILYHDEVTADDIHYVLEGISDFDADNRAGIARTLHRISAIRNRQGRVVGLTCRVGRAVYGTIDMIRDIIQSGRSVLILGKPGVGKTTLLRDAARVLSEGKRVVIVDTSNEIGGDGDIPHPAIGRARRMQVATPTLQHEVMIEAVENHMPEVIIIDEIGRELEAAAARTIAERGVQLVGTAHGNSLDNLMINPTLSDLIGGIQAVTLSDEEARRRGTQKTVLERKAPPTFEVLIEMQSWGRLAIHQNVSTSVDAILRGRPIPAELRVRESDGSVRTEEMELPSPPLQERAEGRPASRGRDREREREDERTLPTLRIYAYGIGQNRPQQAAQRLHLPVFLAREVEQADVVMTLKNYYRKRPQPIEDAEARGVPIYVLRSNTVNQIESCLADIYELPPVSETRQENGISGAMVEAQEAIERVLNGLPMVELTPQAAYVRRRQHELARTANLVSYSKGREPNRRVRIYAERRAQ
ncbi:MAG: AAA family ATPase [Chloroflexi bacterium]|nr:AAA family ATPase [Chloroflexota bacterium]